MLSIKDGWVPAWLRIGIALLICGATPSLGSSENDSSHASIRVWTSANGLPEEAIFGIAETSDGHIWLATRDGVTRFDGQSFRTFLPASQPGLRDNSFGAVLAFDNSLWLGARDFIGVSLTDAFQSHTNPKFRFYPFPRKGADRFGVNGIQLRSANLLWLLRADGIYSFNPKIGKPELTYAPPSGEVITAFHQARDGRVWIGTDAGVYEDQAGRWNRIPNSEPGVHRILSARDGSLWLFGPNGLTSISAAGVKRYEMPGMLAFEPIRGLIEDRDGAIWAGLMAGLARIQNGALTVFDLKDKVRHDDLFEAIAQTSDGAIWAGSKWGSLVRVSSPSFHSIDRRDGLPDSAVSSVLRDSAGSIWLGTRTQGIFKRESNGKLVHVPSTGGSFLYAMAALPDQRLLALDSIGLSVLTPAGARRIRDSRVRSPGTYRAFSPVYGDHMYVGDSEELLKLRLPLGDKPQFESLGPLSLPRSIFESSDGVWAMSWDQGLYHRAGQSSTIYPLDPLHEVKGFTLFELSPRFLLIGSSIGMLGFDREKKRMIDIGPLFAGEQIFAIQPDSLGNLWIGCRRALLVARREEILGYFSLKPGNILPLRFTPQQGLASANFGLGTSSVSLMQPDGELWFASVSGATHFYPQTLLQSNEAIRCAVSAVLADGLEIPVAPSISLPPGTRNVELRYTVLGRRAGESPVFRYRLASGSEPWIESSAASAMFTRLPAGDYVFEIQARSTSLEWSGPPAKMNVRIEPFWFERPEVIAVLLIALCLGAYWLVRYRSAKQEQARKELESRVMFRTAELALARDEAERLRQQAEAAALAKSDFLATMSHEIRTPLNGIIGMLELLRGSPLDEEQKRLLKVVSDSGDSLVAIVNDILNLSKIEAGHVHLEPAPFCLATLVDSLDALYRPQTSAKAIELEIVLSPGLPQWFRADAARLKQILVNLLSNSMKFTPAGEISLHIEASQGDLVRFQVKDSGIGIPAAKLSSIFEPFAQAESSTTRRFGGTGLGLAISLKLAQAMQGTLEVDSVEGEGSTFTLTLPLPACAAPEPAPAPAVCHHYGLRVLVAEDNAVNRHVASGLLKRLGCEVITANDGLAAVEAAMEGRLDLILMDCHMPGLDGFDATRRIRKLPNANAAAPIVALSAGVLDEEVERCRQAGMNQFLAKPVRTEDLAKLLTEISQTREGQPFGWPSSQSN